MQTNNSLYNDLKFQFFNGGTTVRLIFINATIFIFIGILNVIANLTLGNTRETIVFFTESIFSLNTDVNKFMYMPWGLITSMFAHFSFFHFLTNMLMLYFSGKMFEQLFSSKRLLNTYILGGIVGGIIELIARNIFPVFQHSNVAIVGASGSIMAIFIALALYRPQLQVLLFGVLPVKLIILAAIFFGIDLFALASNDGTAHFVHFGGALLGAISIRNINSSKNIITLFQKITDPLFQFFKRNGAKHEPKLTILKGGSEKRKFKSDEEYNYEKKLREEQIDKILDKISKSGYESLSKSEKQFLFDQSKNAN